MNGNKITFDIQGHVALIGINRPEKRNAFEIDMYVEMAKAFGELNKNPELRCGLLFAEGEHFTGGLDLVQWAAMFSEGKFPPLPEGAVDPFGLDEDNRLCKPMVMALQGICYTVGFELLLACDIRVAASNIRLSQLEVKRGIYAVGGATVRLFQEIGWGNAMRYLLTGDEINAQEAYRLGLIQEITDVGKQFDRAMEIASNISIQAPLAVQATLLSARRAKIKGDKAALESLLVDLIPIVKSEDAKEGVMSFIERRPANFKGR
ncbi:MAG: crotonase/enoyl-CoA hydratase family protein [Desulfobacterales bacterium]|nr:crotonase/enoyl-CoA hydratase family protein [Desulfobacterales bacterium]